MRILHVIDGGFRTADAGRWISTPGFEQIVAGVSLLIRRLPHEQRVCVVGPRVAAQRAALGVAVDTAIGPSASGRPMDALVARLGPFDLAQAWSRRVTRLAGRACPADCIARGFPAVLVGGPEGRPPTLGNGVRYLGLPPPVEARPLDELRRAELRRHLGIPAGAPAIMLIGDPPQADALRFAFLMSLLTNAGVGPVGLLPAAAAQLGRGDRFMRFPGRAPVVVSERPTPDLLAAADLAVFDSGGPGPTACYPAAPWAASWPIAQAHAAGVPVVAPAWAAGGLYPSGAADACLAHNASLPELVRKLLPLVDDPPRRAGLASEVRSAIAAADPAREFCSAVERAWTGRHMVRPVASTERR